MALIPQVRPSYWLWLCGCPHSTADDPRRPLKESYGQLPVQPDKVFILGDFNHEQTAIPFPDAEAKSIVVDDVSGLGTEGLDYHVVAGNHDGGNANLSWFTDIFPNATTPHYAVDFGNCKFLMLHDRNDLIQNWGREGGTGGYPTGAITQATFDWLESQIQTFKATKNLFICAHHAPRDTCIATGQDTGDPYHGASGLLDYRGALGSIVANDQLSASDGTTQFVDMINTEGNPVTAWFAAHTHADQEETDTATKSRWEVVNGVAYYKVGHLTQTHGGTGEEHSMMLELRPNSTTASVHFVVHRHATDRVGFKPQLKKTLTLPYAFTR